MTGYMPTTTYGYMLWGLGCLFQMLQDTYTYAETFYINNQELIFDRINNTPGTDPDGLEYDRNACCYYVDPGAEIRMYRWREPCWSQGLDIMPGASWDSITFLIQANYDSVDRGFTGVSGRRHPFAFFPCRYDSVAVIDSNCYKAIITDNFVLMYCWKQGDQRLVNGELRWVTFVGMRSPGIEEEYSYVKPPRAYTFDVSPTLSHSAVMMEYMLPFAAKVNILIYDIQGRPVKEIVDCFQQRGTYIQSWNTQMDTIGAGVYFIHFKAGETVRTEKVLVTR